MEIDIKLCQELDAKHKYRHSAAHVVAHDGYHARCGKMYIEGIKIRYIATRTGSNQISVRSALVNLGLADEQIHTNKKPWTETEIDEIKQMINEKMSLNLIAIKLDRNLNSVRGAVDRIQRGKAFFKNKRVLKKETNRYGDLKICSCGFQIISFNDQCNWCWGEKWI